MGRDSGCTSLCDGRLSPSGMGRCCDEQRGSGSAGGGRVSEGGLPTRRGESLWRGNPSKEASQKGGKCVVNIRRCGFTGQIGFECVAA